MVALEVDRGLVTMEGAKRYGVVLNDDLSVDEAGTNDLREKMRTERGEIKLIDRGGNVEELRAACKEETGLEPPAAPVFREHIIKGLRERAQRAKAGAAAE